MNRVEELSEKKNISFAEFQQKERAGVTATSLRRRIATREDRRKAGSERGASNLRPGWPGGFIKRGIRHRFLEGGPGDLAISRKPPPGLHKPHGTRIQEKNQQSLLRASLSQHKRGLNIYCQNQSEGLLFNEQAIRSSILADHLYVEDSEKLKNNTRKRQKGKGRPHPHLHRLTLQKLAPLGEATSGGGLAWQGQVVALLHDINKKKNNEDGRTGN